MADNSIWVLSNRQDDRVVLWERDPAHPGGEAFVGGPTPAQVGRTGAVEGLLRNGLLIEVPEPADGPKKPIALGLAPDERPPSMPGQVVRLGRTLDPDLYPDGATKKVEDQQARAGDEIAVPAGAVVPTEPEPTRESRRR